MQSNDERGDWYWKVFSDRFKASRPAVFKVAEYLNREKDCTVKIAKMELAPDKSVADKYKDFGDIIVNEKFIVEVKGKTVPFTNKEDFPWNEIIVANVASADRHEVFAFFIVNPKMTHAAVIRGDTKNQWRKALIQDTFKGSIEEKYLCSIDLVEFVKL